MLDHFTLTDPEFERQFKELALNPGLFSHEAHIRLAWIHVTKYGENQAVVNLCAQIRQFDQHYGDGTKYNKTVTIAAVKAVNHFIGKSSADTYQDFIQEFPRLNYNFKDFLAFHYGFDIFNNKAARENYLEPDLLPF